MKEAAAHRIVRASPPFVQPCILRLVGADTAQQLSELLPLISPGSAELPGIRNTGRGACAPPHIIFGAQQPANPGRGGLISIVDKG